MRHHRVVFLSGGLPWLWWVYPCTGRQGRWFGRLVDEAVGVGVVGGCEHDATRLADLGIRAVVNVGEGVQAQCAAMG